jgi:hypothetical protein
MWRLLLTALLALTSSTVFSQVIQKIPAEVPEHTIVVIQGVGDDAEESKSSWVWIIRRVGSDTRPDSYQFESGRVCLFTGPPGSYEIDAIQSKGGTLQQDFARLKIVAVNPVPPKPTPDPTPGPTPGPTPNPSPVPPDVFDNIGQRVAGWASGLPANAAVGSVYLKHAKRLRTEPGMTITSISRDLQSDLASLPNYQVYSEKVGKHLNDDLAKRWEVSPFSMGLLADYWTAIAAGYGAKQ